MPTSKAISASKFLGKDRYEHYLNELLTENTLGGQQLSKAQIKEAFSKRKNRISFEQFVDKVISTKTARAVAFPGTGPIPGSAGGGLGPKGGALVKSPIGALTTYKKLQVSEDKKEVANKKENLGINEYLKNIINSLGNIIKTLNQGVSFDIKNQQQKRRDKERLKRDALEKGLEKGFGAVSKVIERVLAPVKSILSRIIDFFLKMFLARVVVKLIDWLADPKNASKVKSIIRFLGDWWPALLGSYILFGTSFGRFVRGITGLLARFIVQIGKVAIPGLLKFIAKNPVGAAAATLFGVGAAAELIPGMTGQQEQKTKQAPGSAEDKIKALQQQKTNLNIFQKMQGVGSEIDEQIFALQSGGAKSYGFSGGGYNGFVSGEKGVDKVPAMLSDGEFVMSVGAVQKYGVDTLEAMNAAGGGTNKPKVMSGKVYAAEGGEIRRKYPKDTGEKGQFQNREIEKEIKNIKRVIKEKIGYDVDKPETWGQSFSSIFKQKSSGSEPSSRFDFGDNQNQINGLVNQAQQISKGLGNFVAQKIPSKEQAFGALQNLSQRGKNVASGLNPLSAIGKTISDISSKPYFGENALIERERRLGLMKPGADSLTKETRSRLNRHDDWIKSLYDSTKDKGIIGEVKKRFQDIQDKGLLPDFTKMMGLKSEGFEKFVENVSGGKIKNFGASLQGVQMSLKALSGPLGRLQRVEDDGAMGRYLRPAMMEAQKRGHGKVGRAGITGKLYDALLENKIANFALGQTSFVVDKSGRARTGVTGTSADEVWDFNQTAQQNFAQSREALNNFGKILQGKKVTTKDGKPISAGKALYETGFKGLAGMYRMLQNTMYGNLRPMGSNIDLGGGFKPTDVKGKVLSNAQIKAQRQNQITERYGQGVNLYNKPQKNTGQSYKSRFARPKNAGVKPVKPPSKPAVIYKYPTSNKNQMSSIYNRNSRGTGSPGGIKASHPSGTKNKQANLNIRKK